MIRFPVDYVPYSSSGSVFDNIIVAKILDAIVNIFTNASAMESVNILLRIIISSEEYFLPL